MSIIHECAASFMVKTVAIHSQVLERLFVASQKCTFVHVFFVITFIHRMCITSCILCGVLTLHFHKNNNFYTTQKMC